MQGITTVSSWDYMAKNRCKVVPAPLHKQIDHANKTQYLVLPWVQGTLKVPSNPTILWCNMDILSTIPVIPFTRGSEDTLSGAV